MRRSLWLPSALILGLGLAFASAQNINKALQLSQDPTGAIGVDSNNNVYWPGHVLTVGPGAPVLTSCGGGTVAGTDTEGTVSGSAAGGTGCVITFNKAYLATPYCLAVTENMATSPVAFTMTTTALTIGTTMGAAVVHYRCSGSK